MTTAFANRGSSHCFQAELHEDAAGAARRGERHEDDGATAGVGVGPDEAFGPPPHVVRECLRPGALQRAPEAGGEGVAARICRVTEVVELRDPVPAPKHGPSHRVHQPIARPEAHKLGPVPVLHGREPPPTAAVEKHVLGISGPVVVAGGSRGVQTPVDARVQVQARTQNDDAARSSGVPAGAHSHLNSDWRCRGVYPLEVANVSMYRTTSYAM